MRRVRYRRVLPIVQTGLFALLTWAACPYAQMAFERTVSRWTPKPPASGTVGWDAACRDFSPPFLEQIAIGLNAPAAILGELITNPFMRLLRLDCAELDYFNHVREGLFIPVLWFIIGSWIDYRRDRQIRPTPVNWFVLSVALAVLMALAVYWLIVVISYGSLDRLVVYASVLAWLGVGIFVLTRRLWRWRCASV